MFGSTHCGRVRAIETALPVEADHEHLRAAPLLVNLLDEIDGQLAGRLVLVVDDQAAMAYATAMLLDSMACDVVVATSGGQARVRLLEQQRAPDLMLCDFRLNGHENGVDAVQAIRKAVRRSVPAILLSGDTSAASPGVLEDLDACHLLSKPVNPDELMRLVARLLN